MEKQEQLFRIFQRHCSALLSRADTDRRLRWSPDAMAMAIDLVVPLAIHTAAAFFIHLGFKIKERRDLSRFLDDVRKALNTRKLDILRSALADKKQIIIEAMVSVFREHKLPESESETTANRLFEELQSFFQGED